MSLTFLPLAILLGAQSINPYQLDIGEPAGLFSPGASGIYHAGEHVHHWDSLIEAARETRVLLIGEQHDQLAHHKLQGEVIRLLADAGFQVTVGMEMLNFQQQDLVTREALASWYAGEWSDDQFAEAIDWGGQWGMDFSLYAPVFHAARDTGSGLLAINVPREWVRTISREGFDQLPSEARDWTGPLDLEAGFHRQVFNALIGGHPMAGEGGERFYSAQVFWDVAMARASHEWLSAPDREENEILVIIAGNGHVMYNQGINLRLDQNFGHASTSLVPLGPGHPPQVARSLGDFVWVP